MSQVAHKIERVDEAREGERVARGADNDNATVTVLTMSEDELRRRMEVARHAVTRAKDALPGLLLLPQSDPDHARGHLREGEADALRVIFKAAESHPEFCKVLADFDPPAMSALLDRADSLDAMAELFRDMADRCAHTAVSVRARVRESGAGAYGILRPMSEHDRGLRSMLKVAIDFYDRIARKAARTRIKNQEAAEAEAPNTSPEE